MRYSGTSLCTLFLVLLAGCQQPLREDRPLSLAEFTPDGELLRPDVTRWVFMGTNLGLGYASGEFDVHRPGSFQVVYMEPASYDYLQRYGHYADGSQFALAFYAAEEKSEPELNGFSQGELLSFEIHLLDKQNFTDTRAFYLFDNGDESAAMVPAGNECVECHHEHGAFDGTFTQFYPPVRQFTDP